MGSRNHFKNAVEGCREIGHWEEGIGIISRIGATTAVLCADRWSAESQILGVLDRVVNCRREILERAL